MFAMFIKFGGELQATILQVAMLMPVRTIMNYQVRSRVLYPIIVILILSFAIHIYESIASATPFKQLPVSCMRMEDMDGIIKALEPRSSKVSKIFARRSFAHPFIRSLEILVRTCRTVRRYGSERWHIGLA